MRKIALPLTILSLTLISIMFAQHRPVLNDGEMHGDAPYLLEDGWTPLLNGKDLAGWHTLDPAHNAWLTTTGILWDRLLGPTRLSAVPGNTPGGEILNGPTGRTSNLVTDQKFGDVELYLEFMLAKGSNSGVYLHGLYEVQVFDSWDSEEPMTSSDCGGIYHRWINEHGVGGSAPSRNASRRPGEWQSYYIWFRAPRFDANGHKTENAKFIRVVQNGLSIQNNVEVDGPTRAAMESPEAATNPLMLQGDHGPVAYRNIYIRPLRPIIER
jgi:3-keto-disaccharide hydrolase